MKLLCGTVLALVFLVSLVPSQSPGDPDSTFDGDGMAVTQALYGGGGLSAIVVQKNNGKIVVAGGDGGWVVMRYEATGVLDQSFGNGGRVFLFGTGDYAQSMALDGDRILVTGKRQVPRKAAKFTVVRLLSTGILDTSFSGDGIAEVQIGTGSISRGVIVQGDQILLSGYAMTQKGQVWAMARFNENGTLDTAGFGVPDKKGKRPGYVIDDLALNKSDDVWPKMFALQGGKILLGGFLDWVSATQVICRYNPDGSLDGTFAAAGRLYQSFAHIGHLDYWGGILVDGNTFYVSGRGLIGATYKFILARYTENGFLDASYGDDGLAEAGQAGIETNGGELVMQPDGKIIVAGNMFNETDMDIVTFRFLADGSLDSGYGTAGQSVPLGLSGSGVLDGGIALCPGGGVCVAGGSPGYSIVAKYLN